MLTWMYSIMPFLQRIRVLSKHKGRSGTPSKQGIVELFRNNDKISTPFIEYLDKEFFDGNLFSYGFDYHKLIVYGNLELAQIAMKNMLDRGAGLNQSHIDALGNGHAIEKVLAVSVVKMTASGSGVRFCPVHCAAANSNRIYLKQFLDANPGAINCMDSNEASLIHYAAVGDKPDTLKWLIKGPGVTLNRNAKMRKGSKSTPLMWAVQAARTENVRALCEGQSGDIFKVKDVFGCTAFHYIAYSSREDRLESAKALMECGANPNIHGDARLLNKQTPIMICAARGDLDLLKVICENGEGNLTIVDKLDRTPLMFAAKNGHVHVVSYLLREGINVDAKDSSENTAMHYAAAYGWVDCLKILIEVGANFDSKNSWASTPLELALKKGRFACAIVLLKEKVDVNVRDKNGVSLLNSLVSSYMIHLSKNGKAPLPWAVTQIIKREELEVNSVDSSDQTVFHHMAKRRLARVDIPFLKLVDELLLLGADPLKKDKDRKTAAELALKNKNFQLCLKLLQHTPHSDIGLDGENMMHLLMPNITNVEGTLFMSLFLLLHKTNSKWSERMDHQGLMPLLYAARAVRIEWEKHETKGKGKDILEKIFDVLTERVSDVSGRLVKFQNWSDNLMKNGKLVWSDPNEEFANGSRTIIHEILQCPDVEWALQMSSKILNKTKKPQAVRLLNVKTNEGKDALAMAVDSFIHKNAPHDPTLELFQLLYINGAPINNIEHPLFSTISEAQAELREVKFNDTNCSLDDACAYVLYQKRRHTKEILQSGKNNATQSLFTPRLFKILSRDPSPRLLEGLIQKCGLFTSSKDIFGNTALHITKDLKIAEKLIKLSDTQMTSDKRIINAINEKGKSPLMLALDDLELVKLLISNGADVNVVSSEGTALHLAIINERNEVVKELVKICEVNISDNEGRSALHHAVARRAVLRDEVLNPPENMLLQAGSNINAVDKYGRTPLHYCFLPINTDTKCKFPPAELRDPIDMLTTLAERRDLDFGKVDEDMRTPLHYAASVGASICVLYLCENCGESIFSVDSDNNTPLALALRAERADTATMLISKGSKLNVQIHDVNRTRSKSGVLNEISKIVRPALCFALKGKGCQSVARYMLAAKELPVNIILYSLLSTGNFQLTMQQIKLCGPEKMQQAIDEETGRTGLHLVGQVESFAIAPMFGPALVDAMIQSGVNVETTCKNNRTVLHEACIRGHVDLCRHLIFTHRAAIDIKDSKGLTPFSIMFDGHAASAELLCVLADASKNPKTLVNVNVKGSCCKTKEKRWNDMENVVEYLLSTSNNPYHAEELFMKSLLQEREGLTKENQITTKRIDSTPLIEGVLRKDIKLVNSLLYFEADGKVADENGRTVLHHAVMSDNLSMLNLLLRWHCAPVNRVDKYGRSALSYALLALLHKEEHSFVDLLFEHGADPLVGGALKLAIKMNSLSLVERMLRIVQRTLVQNKETVNSYNASDTVWVRYQNCATWELATIISRTSSQVDLLPKILTSSSRKEKEDGGKKRGYDEEGCSNSMIEDESSDNSVESVESGDSDEIVEHDEGDEDNDDTEFIDNESGNKDPLLDRDCFKNIAIRDLSNIDICVFDMEVDMALQKIEDALIPLLPDKLSFKEKRELLKKYKGHEVGLQENLKEGHQKDALVSKLAVGDEVGYLEMNEETYYGKEQSSSILASSAKLHVGKVTIAHENGQYDIDLYSGKLLKQTNRIQLRPLRKELCISTKVEKINICANLVHTCVKPVDYGAFENLALLKALISTGAPVDGQNDNADTPLDLARPGSSIQIYLQNITNSRRGRSLAVTPSVPSTDEINLRADADAEYAAMLAIGSNNSERVIPEVSSVCELDSDGARVMADGDDFFDVALTKVDVEYGQYGKYVFYKMQIIHDIIRDTYVLITNWGRIGEIGKYQQTPFNSKEDCIKEFKKVFKSKSGNEWNIKASFIQKSGKYTLVLRQKTRMKHSDKLLQGVIETSNHTCSLPTAVESMIRFFLDTKALNSAYSCTNIDSSRLPFGQLALSTIQSAEAKLSVIKEKLKFKEEMVSKGGTIQEIRAAFEAIAKVSNEFYELLPMGDDQIVKPFSEDRIGRAFDLIKLLYDLTIAKQLLFGARHRQASMNPIDYVYKALGVEIKPLSANCIERKCLLRYIDNTCDDRNVIIHQIYALNDGKVACDIPNKKLLFHGSKNENILGIFKHGLLIAPPESPVTGWSFGKGIYFADQLNKAIRYASTFSNGGEERPRAFIFVAEVALGISYQPSEVECIEKLPEGTQSTHAIGDKAPDKTKELVLDATGASIPIGELKDSAVHRSQSKWSMYDGCSWWGMQEEISSEDSARIEKMRLDPNTKFPASIEILCHGMKQSVILISPYSMTGRVIPLMTKDDVEMEDIKGKEDEEDKIRINISNNPSSNQTETLVYRRENECRNITDFSEFIVYDTKQVRLKYLIEVTSAAWLKKDFNKKNPPHHKDM